MFRVILDHPAIRNAEQTGYPDRRKDVEPTCPICGAECDTIYKDKHGDIFGCNDCIKKVEAWEVM